MLQAWVHRISEETTTGRVGDRISPGPFASGVLVDLVIRAERPPGDPDAACRELWRAWLATEPGQWAWRGWASGYANDCGAYVEIEVRGFLEGAPAWAAGDVVELGTQPLAAVADTGA